MNRTELLALPVTIDLVTLGKALDLSEPTVRELHRQGRFEEMGIRVLRLGAKWRVITSDIWRVLGVDPEMDAAGPAPPGPAATADDPLPATERSRVHHTSAG